jgi:hypothetical protein
VKLIMSMTTSGSSAAIRGPKLRSASSVSRSALVEVTPGGVRTIGLTLAAADVDYFMAGLDQPRNQERSHVPAATDHHDSRHQTLTDRQGR